MFDESSLEKLVERQREGRQCGKCSLCCKVLDVHELHKPSGKWCSHYKPGRGCTIYETRFEICRGYECMWKQGMLSDEWFPADSKIVLDMNKDGTVLYAHVDSGFPTAWQKEPYYGWFKMMARKGLGIDNPTERRWSVCVLAVPGKTIIVLPDKEVTITRGRKFAINAEWAVNGLRYNAVELASSENEQ